MLFGGRPLPQLPLPVRLVIVVSVLIAFAPMIKSAAVVLQDRFVKLSAEETARILATHSLWGATPGPARDVRCEPGTAGWHYICTFVYQAKVSQKRLKVGVHVGSRSLTHVSPPHELDARNIVP